MINPKKILKWLKKNTADLKELSKILTDILNKDIEITINKPEWNGFKAESIVIRITDKVEIKH